MRNEDANPALTIINPQSGETEDYPYAHHASERFGADPKDIALVEKFASEYGLKVEARDPARRQVTPRKP